MTRAEWVAALNTRLKDSGNELFTAEEKDAHIEAGVQEYSRRRPRLFTTEIVTEAGRQCYPLPEGALWVAGVVLPAPAGAPEGGCWQRGWMEDGGTLWLFPAPAADGLPVRVTCAGAWAPEEVPPEETELVLLAAHARCCEVLATETARTFVFWVGDEKFDKSEVSAHYRALAQALHAELRRKLARH
ncbi:MAG TPA: hypothetical protein GX715_17130 [Armatimonadetes bacterium]|nr:hypothetical protein [Armatimonadota bacterium]